MSVLDKDKKNSGSVVESGAITRSTWLASQFRVFFPLILPCYDFTADSSSRSWLMACQSHELWVFDPDLSHGAGLRLQDTGMLQSLIPESLHVRTFLCFPDVLPLRVKPCLRHRPSAWLGFYGSLASSPIHSTKNG